MERERGARFVEPKEDDSAAMTDPGEGSSPETGEARAAKVLFGKYEVGRLLGCGGYAKVYHARNIQTGQSVAVKCIAKLRVSKGGVAPTVIKREVAVMRRLRHLHIIDLIEVLASRTKIYFVLELAKGGELFARLAARGRLPEDQSRRYFRQLISAVGYCHSRGVFHRDLKPENLLIDDAGDIKVSDFGLSALVADQIDGDGLLHTICGTPAYVAPEILAKKGYDGAAVDLWSCGVILFVLSVGYLPFNDRNLMAMYRKIYRGEYRCPRWISPDLRRLIGRLLDTNPETRITVDGILHDRWFMGGLDEEKRAAMMRFHDDGDNDKISKAAAAAAEEEEDEQRELNAFDIISFSSGFDLSGLFDLSADREQFADRERFVSAGPPGAILDRVEEVGREEGLVVRRRGKKGLGRMVVEGRSGNLVSRVKIQRLTGELVVVEVEKSGGVEERERWGGEFWKEKLRRPVSDGTAGVPTVQVSGPVDGQLDPGS